MTSQDLTNVVLALLLASVVSGCGPDQAHRLATNGSNGPAPPTKPDNVSSYELSAGIEAMTTRVVRIVDAYNKVEPTPTFRYFMHPAMEKDAVIEFDVAGLSSVTLSPRISALDRTCMNDPKAGAVEMSYALDDATPTRFTVDRNYDQLLIVKVGKSRRLTVVVNQGNGVITCDWFGLGVSHVAGNTTR